MRRGPAALRRTLRHRPQAPRRARNDMPSATQNLLGSSVGLSGSNAPFLARVWMRSGGSMLHRPRARSGSTQQPATLDLRAVTCRLAVKAPKVIYILLENLSAAGAVQPTFASSSLSKPGRSTYASRVWQANQFNPPLDPRRTLLALGVSGPHGLPTNSRSRNHAKVAAEAEQFPS